jgi:hypothetical protein
VDLGVAYDPLGVDAAQADPEKNPFVTAQDGYYGWDVAAGCWFVQVSRPGYQDLVSPVVGVPTEVTDLDLQLTPKRSVTRANAATLKSVHGSKITLSGAITNDPSCQGGQQFDVYAGDIKVGSGTTNGAGSYSIAILAKPGSLKVVAPETDGCAANESPTTTVQVAKKVVLKGPTRVRKGARATYKVTVTPNHAGDPVMLFAGTKKYTAKANASGVATFKVRVTRKTVFQGKTTARDGYLAGASKKLTTKV